MHTSESLQTSTYGVVVIKTIKIVAVNLHSSVHKPPKRTTETREKKFLQKFIECRDEPEKKDGNKVETKTHKKTTQLRKYGGKKKT